MIEFVDFVSITMLESASGSPEWAVISVTDSNMGDARVSPWFGSVLRLKFDDLDETSHCDNTSGRPFTRSDAKAIFGFLDQVYGDPLQRGVLVQCELGRSRSAAIAILISGVYGGKFAHARRIDGYSDFVLRTLESVAGKRVPRPTAMMVAPGHRV